MKKPVEITTETLGFINTQTANFHDGFTKAVTSGIDTFAFEFDGHELPGVDTTGPNERLTVVVLIRPKTLADPMLMAIEETRQAMLAEQGKGGGK